MGAPAVDRIAADQVGKGVDGMADNKIHIRAKKSAPNQQGVIKITPEALSALTEVVNETNMSIRQVASLIIIQAVEKGLICYDRDSDGDE